MMTPRIIDLREHEPRSFARDAFADEVMQSLNVLFPNQVDVDPPSFKTDHQWRLTARGWIGHIPLADDLHLAIAPKVPIANVFGMLEVAYRLKGFKILEGLAGASTIADFYDRLAIILARRVLDRIRKGLYRTYVREAEALPYLRGRLDLQEQIRNPIRVPLPCQYEEHTADIEENQILLWTLTRILQSGLCSARSLPYVRQARRALQSVADTRPVLAQDCVNRLYNRLNDDYEPMHALCRFFLEHTGPTHKAGGSRMLPFLIDMDRLFELFVAEWLTGNMPEPYVVRPQVRIGIGSVQDIEIRIDITIEDRSTGATLLVLDTKYKATDRPEPGDLQQVVAYAAAQNCPDAALVYPRLLPQPLTNALWGSGIRVSSLAFCLDGDINACGQECLHHLLGIIEARSVNEYAR